MLRRKEQSVRKTGIDILDDVPWGTHFCLFYETKKDLIDILVPYFKTGLESNEFCIWVTLELSVEEAKDVLRKSTPELDRYQEKGQIKIVSYSDWYFKDGVFNLQRVLNAWVDQLNQALASGFAGMRVTGSGNGCDRKAWKEFAGYEKQVNKAIDKYRMIAICSYCIGECGASEIIDVVNYHQFAIIRREGKWEVIESAERKKTMEALQASEKKYRTLLENLPQKIFLKDKDSVYISCNENYAKDLKIKAKDIIGKTDYDFFSEELAHKYRADDKRIIKSVETEDINEKYILDGKEVIVHTVKTPVKDDRGNVAGILGIFWDITAQRQAQKRLLDYQKRLRDLTSEMSLTEERERRRIAGELHDQVTQNLVLFKINLGQLREKDLPRGLVKSVDEIYKHLDQIIQDMRFLIFDLGSPTLYELGLETAVREYLNEEIQQKHGIKTEFEDDAQHKPLDSDICALLYRAVRELLINVVKHAQAQWVKVSVYKNNDNICINVADDGVGFNPPSEGFGSSRAVGFGLFSIRERLSYIGGSFDIESKPGEGTRVTLVAPMNCGKHVEKLIQ
jgi:PAS domain S-box-containing protein